MIKTYGARTKFDADHLIICNHKLNYCSIEFIYTIFFQHQTTFSFRKFYVKVKFSIKDVNTAVRDPVNEKFFNDPLEIDIWKLNTSSTTIWYSKSRGVLSFDITWYLSQCYVKPEFKPCLI